MSGFLLRPLTAALALGLSLAIVPATAEPITGAGSTFAAPIIGKWAKSYQDARTDGGEFTSPDWTVDYEPVGSLAGIMRLDQPELDFAATDAPVTPDDLAKRGRKQFPIVMGGIAVVVNLHGVHAGFLRLTGPLLADIYLGKIQSWSDPAIKAINPDAKLPDIKIEVVQRKDGSGSTFTLTQYLSAISPEWKTKYGAEQLIAWPVGRSVEGSQGVVRSVSQIHGAIGYVEYGQVQRAGLSYAVIQNRAGNFTRPDPASVQAAASNIDWSATKDFYVEMTNLPGADAYPIAAATFVVMPVQGRSPTRYGRVHDLFRLAFDNGAADAAALGYVPLPPALVQQVKQYWAGSTQAAAR